MYRSPRNPKRDTKKSQKGHQKIQKGTPKNPKRDTKKSKKKHIGHHNTLTYGVLYAKINVFRRKRDAYMARKKKEPPIISLGNEDKLTVQKSLPLFSLWRSPLTLPEFKILDTYLSRINSHNPNKRTVVFEKGELEQILGVKRIRMEELDERLAHLGTPIRIDDVTAKNKKFARISLFEKSVAEQGDNGIWKVELTASQSAMKYFFNIESLRYLRYKLRCVTSFKSRYTYIMFTYLERNRFRKSWEVSVEELKNILACEDEPLYSEFKRFNDKLLKRIQREMHEKSECRYTYEPIKKGRTVVAIRFEVETLPKLEIEVPEVPEAPMAEEPSRPLWESALDEWKLSQAQLEEIQTLLVTVPVHKLPNCQKEDLEKAYYQYMAQKAAEIKRRNEQKRIRSRYSYLRKLMQEDIASKPPQEGNQQSQAVARGTQAFQNFTERKNNNYTSKIMDKLKSDLKEFQENQEAAEKNN